MGCTAPNQMVELIDHTTGEILPPEFAGALKRDQPPQSDDYRRYITVPCGTCQACKLERSRQWAVRCMHEASLYEYNCFITLTYDDEHLPYAKSLNKEDFQKFMKRLRRRHGGHTIRYFHCGEYGERHGRPHYHACLFNFDFADKVLLGRRNELPVWRSPILENLWRMGRSEIGSVTFESAAYVARYILKKQVDPSRIHELREPEYCTMSRGGRNGNGGIGKPWLRRYETEVFPRDSVITRGMPTKPPRYYDLQFELSNPEAMAGVRRSRELARTASNRPNSQKTRAADAEILKARLTLRRRNLE